MKKKKTVRKKKTVVRRKKTSPYAEAEKEIYFDPYDPLGITPVHPSHFTDGKPSELKWKSKYAPTVIHSETTNSGPTLTEEFELGKPGWWSRMWRRVFG